ncbi:MAG: hypothetical protein V3R95_01220 [Dehalococcoidia bacterium]
MCTTSRSTQPTLEAIARAAELLKIAAFEGGRAGDRALAESCATIVLEVEDLARLAAQGAVGIGLQHPG